jgi:dolichol-phosphate mannosyltransferase
MAVLSLDPQLQILVVDDSSPDGTGAIVKKIQSERVHLLTRLKKEGLGRAYIAGFQWGMERGFDVLVEMDADFSHRPSDLIRILEGMGNNDFAVGSRYIAGGATVNWGLGRKLISRGGSLYARLILGYPLRDWTGGFNAWTRAALDSIGLSRIHSEGYSFQIELKYRALREGLKGIEIPIVFEDRRVGQSKMSLRVVLEAFYRVWVMRFA